MGCSPTGGLLEDEGLLKLEGELLLLELKNKDDDDEEGKNELLLELESCSDEEEEDEKKKKDDDDDDDELMAMGVIDPDHRLSLVRLQEAPAEPHGGNSWHGGLA